MFFIEKRVSFRSYTRLSHFLQSIDICRRCGPGYVLILMEMTWVISD